MALRPLIDTYAPCIEQLLLDGIRDVVDAVALDAIAERCPSLRELALTLSPGRDSDSALEDGLRAVGMRCRHVTLLRLDSSARPHHAAVASLALHSFARLRSLTLWCFGKGGGLLDSEFELLLSGRTALESLALRSCEGLSENLFPRLCNRGERHDEAEVALVRQLDQALLHSLNFGCDAAPPTELQQAPQLVRKRRHLPRSPAAIAMRSLTSMSLSGAASLTDRSGDALAELLHDAQTVDLRGCPSLSEESLRAFRKGCRLLRSVTIFARDRTLSWTAAAAMKTKHHRKASYSASDSSAESN